MSNNYWRKQASDQPLFPDLLWSRPENKAHAGKLLIIGGSASGFSAPASAFASALAAGIGSARVLLPKSLETTVGQLFPEAEFAPNNASGSFASDSLAALVDASDWADGVLLAGDFGRNSETAILLEKYAAKYTGQLALAGDSIYFFLTNPEGLLARNETLLVPNFSQLQKLASSAGIAITSQLGLIQLVEKLHEFSNKISASIISSNDNQILVVASGQISSTPVVSPSQATTGQTKTSAKASKAQLAASATVWWLQNPSQTFEALTTAVLAIN